MVGDCCQMEHVVYKRDLGGQGKRKIEKNLRYGIWTDSNHICKDKMPARYYFDKKKRRDGISFYDQRSGRDIASQDKSQY